MILIQTGLLAFQQGTQMQGKSLWCFRGSQTLRDLFTLHLICASCPCVIMAQHRDMLKDHQGGNNAEQR